MRKAALIAVLVLTATAFAVPTVTVTLESSKAGGTVAPGGTVDWAIKVLVSSGDNDGLALFATDFIQDPANTVKIDVPPATAVPAGMVKFARPQGIANPDEAGKAGYLGVQRGTSPGKNLVQIGGGQNTFGTALAAGSGIGENAIVAPGIGQGAAVTLASGTFTVPLGTATGTAFTFRLQNAIANVLNFFATDPVPPAHWPVTGVTVSGVTAAAFTFTVAPSGCPGDGNCDGQINWRDIDYLIAGQNDNVSAWTALFPSGPTCPFLNLDTSGDSHVNWRDIDPFIALMNTTCH
jgi:hypothetical protein